MVSQFHFAAVIWLWGILLIPLIGLCLWLLKRRSVATKRLYQFADKHLIPHIIANQPQEVSRQRRKFISWSLLWFCLMLALAGPRWDFHEIDSYTADQALVILLDLSKSMDAEDLKPSRIVRAKQEIEDILNASRALNLGVVGFAAAAHMINPITDDKAAIRLLLPALGTDLVDKQGSRLTGALTMAKRLLDNEPGKNKSILVLSDGDFSDASAIQLAHQLSKQGIVTHCLGIGTESGAPIPRDDNSFIQVNGQTQIATLDEAKLSAIADAGGGIYRRAHFSDQDTQAIIQSIERKTAALKQTHRNVRQWNEQFFWLLIPVLCIVGYWFRQGTLFSFLLVFSLLPAQPAQAQIKDWFLNSAQQAAEAFEQKDYTKAEKMFDDSYRKGVAQYKAGQYQQAEQSFLKASRPAIQIPAQYNLGNARFQQGDFQGAIKAYENVLAKVPEHENAQHNLALAKQMLQQQKQEQQQQQQQNNQSDAEQNQQEHASASSSQESSEDKESKQQQRADQNQQNKPDSSNTKANRQQKSSDSQHSVQKPNPADKQEAQANASSESQTEISAAKEDNNQPEQSFQARGSVSKTPEDWQADQWLNRITNNPKAFLKNQFYIESKRNAVEAGSEPW